MHSGAAAKKSKVESLLREAVDAFRVSLDKAESIKSINSEDQESKRQEALAHIATSMLSLGLNEVAA